MGHFQLFSMILKFSMGLFLSFYTDFYGPFSKLMGLWCMAPCLPNHCTDRLSYKDHVGITVIILLSMYMYIDTCNNTHC